jgi:hypothetical protein
MISSRWPAFLALVFVLAGSYRIASTWPVFNHTIDEPDTLAAGMEYLTTGRFLYEDTHPPLGRVFAAIGPFLAGERFRTGPRSYGEGYRILGHGAHYVRILTLGRAGNLVFFWVASLVVYLWGWRAGGSKAALAATLLFTTLPPVLAHAGLMTTDFALCAMTSAAALASLYWAALPSRGRSVLLGVLIALACVSKFSALLYLPAAWLAMGACHLAVTRQRPAALLREAWNRRRSLALVAGTAALAIWAVYGFTFARVEFLHLRLPAPRFFSGIHSVWLHNRRGHPAYLLGQRSPNGFWYYFPTVLALKTPLAMWGLLALAPWLWKNRRHAALAAVFSFAILLIAMRGHIDLGVRYLLPVYTGFAVVCGCAAAGAQSRLAKSTVALLIAWQVVSGALCHPDYLAYTNEIAGSHPENFLADSDLDWGQDMKRLAVFLDRHHATEVTFVPFNRTYGALAGERFPTVLAGDPARPSPGWNAVSVSIWKIFDTPTWPNGQPPPQARIGRSILLWYFP